MLPQSIFRLPMASRNLPANSRKKKGSNNKDAGGEPRPALRSPKLFNGLKGSGRDPYINVQRNEKIGEAFPRGVDHVPVITMAEKRTAIPSRAMALFKDDGHPING